MAETGTKVKQKQKEREDAKVEVANSISILDYANKNDMDVLYEDKKIARIETPGGEMLTVFKDRNSWSISNREDERAEYGNTIRFVAKMENNEWREALDKLVADRGDYLSSDQYNAAYAETYNLDNQDALESVNTRNKDLIKPENLEFQTAKTVRISDYAKAIGLPTDEVNRGKTTVIRDPRFEGILIYNNSNKWDWHSNFVRDADVIKFAERVQGLSREEAIKSLVAFKDTGIITEIQKQKESENIIKQEEVLSERSEEKPTEETSSPEEIKNQQSESSQGNTDNAEKESLPISQLQSQCQTRKTMSKEQLSEILSGYRRGIDVTSFDNVKLSPKQMRQLRLAEQNGIDSKGFSDSSLSAEYMKEMRLASENGVDLSSFKNEENKFVYSAEQAKEIRLGKQYGLAPEEVAAFAKEELDPEVMKEMRLGLQDGMIQMRNLGNGSYTAKDIHSIRMTIMVNHIVDTIKVQLRNFFDNVVSIIKRSLTHDESTSRLVLNSVNDQTTTTGASPNIDIEKEAINEFKDIIENIYDAMETELQDLPLTERKDAIVSALRIVINQAKENDLSAQSDIEKNQAIEQAVDTFAEEIEVENLKQAAYESLEEEYVEQFYQNENDYNDKLYEFSNSVINDNAITHDQKEEIINRTLGVMFGKETAAKWIGRLPVEENTYAADNELPNENLMKMIQEEYESTMVIEETQMEVG